MWGRALQCAAAKVHRPRVDVILHLHTSEIGCVSSCRRHFTVTGCWQLTSAPAGGPPRPPGVELGSPHSEHLAASPAHSSIFPDPGFSACVLSLLNPSWGGPGYKLGDFDLVQKCCRARWISVSFALPLTSAVGSSKSITDFSLF